MTTVNSQNSIYILVNIDGNEFLELLNGLENLTSCNTNIYIGVDHNSNASPNPNLTDFCGIQNLLSSGNFQGNLLISNNAYNPTVQEIIDGYCSE